MLLDINIRFTLNMAFFAYCVEHFLIDSLIINIIYIRKENDFAKVLKIFSYKNLDMNNFV